MWPFGRKREERFPWIDVGKDNPFSAPVSDIHGFTQTMISTTQDQSVAENFSVSRSDDGQQYIGKAPADAFSIPTDITYPHNGDELDGIIYKAPEMEVKWDIYAYGGWFYFVRSWTSDLIYKVRFENTGTTLNLKEIHGARSGGVRSGMIFEVDTATSQPLRISKVSALVGRPRLRSATAPPTRNRSRHW